MLIAVTHVSRLAFAFLPNVQPVTVIIILITVKLGVADGLLVGSFSMILSNLTLGMGPWTIGQILAYIGIVLITAVFKKIFNRASNTFVLGVIFSGLTGYLYGLFISIVQAPILGMSIETLIGYWIAGLPFDTYHAIGNVGFFIILEPIVSPLLQKVKLNINK